MKSTVAALLLTLGLSPALAASDAGWSEAKTFKVSKGGSLDMSINLGDIRVIPWEKDEVSLRVRGMEDEDLDDLRITHDANSIVIRYNPGWYGSTDGRFELNVPSTFSLDLETNAGEIDVAGKMTGKIHARSAGGDLRVDDVDGMLELSTSGGDLLAGGVTGAVTLETAGGNIRIGAIGGDADIRTAGGDITIDRVGRGLVAHTAGGNVNVGDVGGTTSVATNGGDIILGHVAGGAKLRTAGGNIDLASAAGTVSAQTSGGDIRLDSVNGDVDARTGSGDIVVLLNPSGKERSRLSTSVGDVRLYLPEKAKASIDARLRVHGRWSDATGSIESDFDAVKMEKNREEREIRATYTINGGGPEIAIEVSLGDIDIRKADAFTKLSKTRRKSHNR